MSSKALKPGSLILITGVNGYVGGHVAHQLLSLGYRVRGTARDQAKVDIATAGLKSGHFEGVILADMTSQDAFRNVVTGCDAVVHVASDVSFGADPNVVVTGTVNALKSVLTAAAKEPTVKRFVYTSSVIAATDPSPEVKDEQVINSESWNAVDVEKAWAPPPYTQERSMSVYGASKVAAEKAAWDFVKTQKPGFVLNSVLPSMCLGPLAFKGQNPSTSVWVHGLYTGDEGHTKFLANFPPVWAVDIRDVARAHVAALLETDVVSRRIISSTEPCNFSTFVSTMKKINPERKDWPPVPEKAAVDTSKTDNSLALELLKREGRSDFIYLEETIRDLVAV